ncbi:MAG TPA: ArsA family ATPase [Kineosporiaceae bacterium]
MRVLLFTGKGGVGKTTVAAATAVHAARCGVKTLVASADTAHSLADCLGRPLGAEPVELEVGLSGVHVDARVRGERSWRAIQEYLVGVLDGLGVDPIAAEELTVLPGADEVLALLEVRDLVGRADHDLLVVDCAPSAETLRLLALPEALSRYLELSLPVERRVRRAMAAGARAWRGQDGGILRPRDHVVEAAERLHVELAGIRQVLAGPETSARLVLTPEALAIAEARRTLTALALYGYLVDGVVANRLVPADGRDGWQDGWAWAQAERLGEAEASFRPAPVLRLGYASTEPIGLAALAELGETLYGAAGASGARRLLQPPDPTGRLRVERDGTEFVLILPMPDADRGEMSLARVGDDLCVQVGGHRRALSLPSALRRCVVQGARLTGGQLRVRFQPDPALWRSL